MHWAGLGLDGVEHLCSVMAKCTRLMKLNLGYNGLGAEGTKALAESLAGFHPQLTELQLQNNGIGEDGAKWLAMAVAHCTRIGLLDLGCNGLRCSGFMELTPALGRCCELKTLDLGNNSIKTGASTLAEALKNCTSLLHLRLKGNHLGNEEGKLQEQFSATCTLYL